jgi:hypothetical protein
MIVATAWCEPTAGQVAIDTVLIELHPPDSVYARRSGSHVVIGWYQPPDSIATTIGSKDFRNWYTNDLDMSDVTFTGAYALDIDRTVRFSRLTRDTVTVGVDTSIVMLVETADRNDTYNQRINIGSNHYTPGELIPIALVGEESRDTLDFEVNVSFSAGDIGVSILEDVAFFEIDFQDFEGFHVWRGLSPYPSDQEITFEFSKEDAFLGIRDDSLYALDWPQYDVQGRPYYEWIDQNAFVGFTYYYNVTTFDRGYFKGRFQHNKEDNYVCDEDLDNPLDPENPIDCNDVMQEITMTVSPGTNVSAVYVVPNPYRTGTSAETSPYYHNFPDMTIKFYNVPREASIKIYTVSGDLVWETYRSNPEGADGVVSWDTRNKEGLEVGSGVYVYKCESGGGDYMYGRIVIIR